jgi:peptidoglycan/LPS O-acetylase OafA/YrhL
MTATRSEAADAHPVSSDVGTKPGQNIAIGYLRAFVTLLVLAHHAVLAYHPFAPPVSEDMAAVRWWQAFPVVDDQRSEAVALFVGFNDTFFISLLFFLSGLFVWRSLERKGPLTFLRDRALRLGVPFVVAAALVAPLAYYPAYLPSGGAPGLTGFWSMWSGLRDWPAGPAWFIWVLLAFGAFAAVLSAFAPGWGSALGERLGQLHRPRAFFAVLVATSALAYLPLALIYTPLHWTSFGPFAFQTSRLLLYLVYFLFGVGLGAYGLERGLLAAGGALARVWRAWSVIAVLTFIASVVVVVLWSQAEGAAATWGTAAGLTFVVSCAAISLSWLALFSRFARARVGALDSLSRNAYGMYLIHYPFASWIPYALLHAPLSAPAKASIAILGTVVLSWATTSALRRLGPVARVI